MLLAFMMPLPAMLCLADIDCHFAAADAHAAQSFVDADIDFRCRLMIYADISSIRVHALR